MRCGLGRVLSQSSQSETVIVISSEQSLDNDASDQSDLEVMVDQGNIPVFLLLWPETRQSNNSDVRSGARNEAIGEN